MNYAEMSPAEINHNWTKYVCEYVLSFSRKAKKCPCI